MNAESVFALFGFFTGILQVSAELRLVHVLWRHGDRNPVVDPFPTDIENGVQSWPEGLGQLTTLGRRQQYDLGNFLRRRYVDTRFLSWNYNASELYVRSSDYPRTIQSAMANMAGFYPNSGWYVGSSAWTSIPISTVPLSSDNVISVEKMCPRLASELNYLMNSDYVRRIDSENRDFIDFLRASTGIRDFVSVMQIGLIYDQLNCQKIHNHRWPKWVNDKVFENVTRLNELAMTLGYDTKIARLRGGMIFREIATRSEAKALDLERPKPGLKYYAYSGHDTTIITLLQSMGAFDGRLPPYASALIFEMHEYGQNEFIIRVFYINKTGSEYLIPIQVAGCRRFDCDLRTFVDLAKSNSPSDWSFECGSGTSNRDVDKSVP